MNKAEHNYRNVKRIENKNQYIASQVSQFYYLLNYVRFTVTLGICLYVRKPSDSNLVAGVLPANHNITNR